MKIVKESLNQTFTRNEDKLSSIGVGKIDMIKKWIELFYKKCKEEVTFIADLVINDDLTINSMSNLVFPDNIGELPSYIQFNKVYGYFNCNRCELKTLRGCPKEVIGNYKCQTNKLTSLEYGPTFVKGYLDCEGNNIPTEEVDKFKHILYITKDI